MSDAKDYQAFRAAVLEGTDPAGLDTPIKRALAASVFYNRAAAAAADHVAGAQLRVEKATAELKAAKESVKVAIADRAAADAEAALGSQLAAEFLGTDAMAGTAGAVVGG